MRRRISSPAMSTDGLGHRRRSGRTRGLSGETRHSRNSAMRSQSLLSTGSGSRLGSNLKRSKSTSNLNRKQDPIPRGSLESQTYYHGLISDEEVESLLVEVGQFVVYFQYGDSFYMKDDQLFLLTLRKKPKGEPGSLLTMLIAAIKDGNKTKYSIDDDLYKCSIPALINHYVSGKVSIDNSPDALLKTPVPKSNWIIPGGQIICKNILGEGQFGTVSSGVYMKDGKLIHVAVKSCKDPSMEPDLREAHVMRYVNHTNVVKFYGICLEREFRMILELVDGGSIDKILRNDEVKEEEKTKKMLIPTGWGLEYLHYRKIIHRDISSRNVLYTKDKVVKITDFGMSREGSQYTMNKHTRLPVPWYPPEALERNVFDNRTDIWSFGGFLYELFSNGKPPYSHIPAYNEAHFKKNWVVEYYRDPKNEFPLPEGTPKHLSKIFLENVFVPHAHRESMTVLMKALEKAENMKPQIENNVFRKKHS